MNNDFSEVLGTVAMVPKGEYDSTAYYEYLNVVTYEGSTYMAKKNVNNVLPTDEEYWQFIAGGVTKEYLEAQIIDELTSTSTNESLSANQGKVLNDSKISISDIIDNLTSSETSKPLSANQGKVLKSIVDGRVELLYGETADRPTTNLETGKMYFDTTLTKPIWYDGTNWVDATGTQV